MLHHAEISQNNSSFPVIDGHVDLLYLMMQKYSNLSFADLPENHLSIEKLKQGNVRVIISAFYCEDRFNGPEKSVPHLKTLFYYAEKNLKSIKQIITADDLNRAFFTPNHLGSISLLENGDSLIDMTPEDVAKTGFAAVGLTHAGKNRIADGNGVKSPKGLTRAGRNLIKLLENQKIIIDTAHLAEPGFWELIDLFNGPVIASHTGFKKFCDLPRNLSEDQIKVLVEKKAVIGITVNPEMLAMNQKAGIDDIVFQIDWAVQKFGIENIGIGSDFGGFDIENNGMENSGLFGTLAEKLISRGYLKNDVAGIMGTNWHRFYLKNLP